MIHTSKKRTLAILALVAMVLCFALPFASATEPAPAAEIPAPIAETAPAADAVAEAPAEIIYVYDDDEGNQEIVDLVAAVTEYDPAKFDMTEEEKAAYEKMSEEEKLAFDAKVAEEKAAYEEEFAPNATSYIDNYSTIVGKDPAFDSNLEKSINKTRESIPLYATWWALLPPLIAIALALITKEVYSSLFIGILSGAVMYGFQTAAPFVNVPTTLDHLFSGGFIASVADGYNIGILIFLVVLGTIVALMNKSGGSAAFGRWAAKHIKSRVGAQLATILLGILIFVDDYFNCLTVGSVMRPVSDKLKVSRSKLAYIIDATAAPICIIAPISSWAAAVAGFVSGETIGGFELFVRAIPYNFYAILTIIMMVTIVILKLDFGPMKKHERNAVENGDIFSSDEKEMLEKLEESDSNKKGIVLDLIAPVFVLIAGCIIGLLYSGGLFTSDEPITIIEAFSGADASVGLVIGSFAGLIFSVIYFLCRRVLNFKQCMEALPEGFKAMVPAILILCCAWTLKTMTDSIGAKIIIAEFVNNYAQAYEAFLPAIVFLIGVILSFSTGTSWGTFGILIPIVLAVFGGSIDSSICIISISACMAGAVCGDHCSPISDTTIMASAGAQCNHMNHVSTQLPYAITTAAVSFVAYIVAGFIATTKAIMAFSWIALPIAIVLMLVTLVVIKVVTIIKRA